MRCIREIVNNWSKENDYDLHLQEFEVRKRNEVPGTDFDIYISSGGPGSPLQTEGEEWEKHYFNWVTEIENWNKSSEGYPKKYVFFICHSFQLLCRHYKVGLISQRISTSFGVFPIHVCTAGQNEVVFDGLKDPFYAVDSRDYQVTKPDEAVLEQLGATILAIEKDRPHVPYDRAVMAIRFNEYFIGTQFHPEADATGMTMYLLKEDKKEIVMNNHGEAKWKSMIEQLNDPDKIRHTYQHILPNFLNEAMGSMVVA